MHCLHINCTAVLYSLMLNNKRMSGTPICIFYIITVLQFLGEMKTELCLYAAQKLQYNYFVNNNMVVTELNMQVIVMKTSL